MSLNSFVGEGIFGASGRYAGGSYLFGRYFAGLYGTGNGQSSGIACMAQDKNSIQGVGTQAESGTISRHSFMSG